MTAATPILLTIKSVPSEARVAAWFADDVKAHTALYNDIPEEGTVHLDLTTQTNLRWWVERQARVIVRCRRSGTKPIKAFEVTMALKPGPNLCSVIATSDA